MDDCIFCKIIAGDIPSECVLSTEAAFAFMDIGPLAAGHCLLIPRSHYETVDQMPAEEAAAVLGELPALVKAVQTATGCKGVNVLQNNGRVANQLVPHVHFHIIPRNPNDAWSFNWPAGEYTGDHMAELGDAIRKALS
ncbi:MAG: HIT family protein [Lentisphaerae bacterium]|jgi:histidine triad (HIT) family protein|nr:HIT family protein [Lentisphaerota bacterium]MBT4819726.1 HIT family protein [Lentisphaerota bacterium]MBT5607569.1 HIT family protein [Lentisphaerota bacterium]MBT7054570.1 HIT family protein [Lentisphaerota bacterium]MBT7845190.1 HIT family protein [Lentisphaerota bacterium]